MIGSGDIFCLMRGTKPSWLARQILFWTRRRGEKPSKCFHTGTIADREDMEAYLDFPDTPRRARRRIRRVLLDHPDEQYFVVEALWRGTPTPQTTYRGSYEIWRLEDVDIYKRAVMVRRALSHVGKRYSVPEIVTHLFDGLASKILGRDVYMARRLAQGTAILICSALTEDSARAGGYDPPRGASPDCLHDWLMAGAGNMVLSRVA